jgi:putative endonuclease
MNIKIIKQWEVYIIEAESGLLYTGITNDLDQRFESHLKGSNGAKFFRFSNPKRIVFRESHPNRSEATKREIEIKRMTKIQKLTLINNYIN